MYCKSHWQHEWIPSRWDNRGAIRGAGNGKTPGSILHMGQTDIGNSCNHPFVHPRTFHQRSSGEVLKCYPAIGSFFNFGDEFFTDFGLKRRWGKIIGKLQFDFRFCRNGSRKKKCETGNQNEDQKRSRTFSFVASSLPPFFAVPRITSHGRPFLPCLHIFLTWSLYYAGAILFLTSFPMEMVLSFLYPSRV